MKTFLNQDFMAQGSNLIVIAVMAIVMYFVMIRPQSKKKKEKDQMMNSLEIGDEIITIGGIMGRIVSLREDTDYVVIETGSDRNRIKIKRWAIEGIDGVKAERNKKIEDN